MTRNDKKIQEKQKFILEFKNVIFTHETLS